LKAITILQPWASLIACGKKQIETRSWPTKYRGPIAIHAGARFDRKLWNLSLVDPIRNTFDNLGYGRNRNDLPLGAVIAIADLIACEEMTMDKIVAWRDVYGKAEIAFGDFQPGRYAWILENVRQIKPVPAKGMQRLWEWEGCNQAAAKTI